MAHGDTRKGKWRGNWWMQWVANTLHTISEHGVSSITTADAHTSAASTRLNWRPRRFKWTRPFRRKTKSGFYACAITFQTQYHAVGGGGPKGQTDLPWPAVNIRFVSTVSASTEVRPCGTKHLEVEELTVIGIAFEEHHNGKCHVYCNLPSSDTLRVDLQLRLSLLLEDMFLLITELTSVNNCAVTEGQSFHKSQKWSINSLKHRCFLKDSRHNLPEDRGHFLFHRSSPNILHRGRHQSYEVWTKFSPVGT